MVFCIEDYFGDFETHTITVAEEQIHVDVEYSKIGKSSNRADIQDYPSDKEEFLDGLRELHIGEWRTNYTNPYVLDGIQWELKIEFSNGRRPFKTGGSNAYPYNFNEL